MDNQAQTSTTSSLDPQVVDLAKSFRQVESGNNPTAEGKSGEYGLYQYTEPTWDARAKKYGVNVPLREATPAQQNEVQYKWIKDMKDKGYNVGQIASMHNAGEGNPDAYKENFKGTNKYGVSYDVPAYAEKIAKTYQELKGQNPGYNPKPFSNPTGQFNLDLTGSNSDTPPAQDDSLSGKLKSRLSDATNALTQTQSGAINPVSGILQTVGAGAGAVNDVVGKGLELIPGVKQAEGLIGKGVGKLAQTDVGQKVVGKINDFSTAHPELSKDIGSVGNIAGVVGLASGAGEIKDAVGTGLSKALGGAAEKSVVKELGEVAGRTVGGRAILNTEGDSVLKTLATKEFTPTIEAGKYVTKDSFENLGQAISNIEDHELQPALQKASTQAVADRTPLEGLRKEALAGIKEEFKATGQVSKAESEVNKIFDDYKNSYGDYVTLQDVNDMKRGIRQSVNFNSPKLESDVSYHIGQTFQKNIEDSASKLGLGDVKAINQKMAKLIKAQKLLKSIEGKSVKTGIVRKLLSEGASDVGSGVGEAIGNATGIPVAGALAGRGIGNIAGKVFSKGTVGGLLGRFAK